MSQHINPTPLQTDVKALNDSLVKIDSISNVKPSASGNLYSNVPNSRRILNAWVNNSTGYIVVPWKTTYDTNWYFHFYDASGNTVTSEPTISQVVYAYVVGV